jgi:CheY-like chemotaxis protein/HPt (histidine-containing phosphotransfer) domain-containing protein
MPNIDAPVLIVDDHPVNQRVLQILLNYLGFSSHTASNGSEAINLATTNQYAVILMDLMMPVVDGFEATEKIREFEFATGRHTPIIAVTALSQDHVRERCLSSGMDDYISKPISREILRAKLDHWMQLTMTVTEDDYQSDAVAPLDEYPIDKARLKLLYEMDDLEPILKLFLEVTETLMGELKSAIGEKNVGKVEHTAHELKGSSYAVSAREMAKLSLELEHAGAEERWSEALKIYTGLALGFLRVKEFLSKEQIRQDFSRQESS